MKKLATAALLIAACTAASAQSQEVYRCGNSYSQKPCAGGAALQVDDSRSAAQSKASIEQTHRDAKTADDMQRARLTEEEKMKPTVATAKAQPEEYKPLGPVPVKKADFTATEPRKKKQPAAKKKAESKKATKKTAAKDSTS